MPVAAVPRYLGEDFSSATPALRFGIYLPIWTDRADQERELRDRQSKKSQEAVDLRSYQQVHGLDKTIASWVRRERGPLPGLWAKNDHAARKAWEKVTVLSEQDQALMKNLLVRQEAAAAVIHRQESVLRLDALATAPFVTGLGNEHPLENGFAFLNPYGLPYLPGSGVKGVLRQAACELAHGEWGGTQGWDPAAITALFGQQSNDGATDHQRGTLSFWDVVPQVQGNNLAVEIMTPHHGHYYQWKTKDSNVSPHDSGMPNPICFLTVPPKSRFVFHVHCDLRFLRTIAPILTQDGQWQVLMRAAFEHAFQWLGFGAKTAVGYGAFREDIAARQVREREQQETRDREQRVAEREAAVSGLPADAVWVVNKRLDGTWTDNGVFLGDVENFLAQFQQVSEACRAELAKEMEQRWRGVMGNPDAVAGKRQEPKFKERQRALAKRLLVFDSKEK